MSRFGLPVSALIALMLIVAGCGGSTPPAEEQATPAAPAESVADHMADHFSHIRDIEQAVIRGDLEAAQAPAQWIVEHQTLSNLPADSAVYLAEIRNSASGVAATDDLGNAAVATATMVAACGKCHTATGVTPPMPDVPQPAGAEGITDHMKQHMQAVDLMYEGLAAPSDDLWKKGAGLLKASPLEGESLPQELSDDVKAAEARVHEMADRATNAADTGAKIAIYGELIGGCASCHGLHGKVWGPGVPKVE
jgi:cytochrome c553